MLSNFPNPEQKTALAANSGSDILPALLLFLLLTQPTFLFANEPADNTVLDDNEARLESLKIHLKETEQDKAQAVSEQSTLQDELKQNEIMAGEVAGKLKGIQNQLETQKTKLSGLQAQQRNQEKELGIQRKTLSNQVRSAYMTGRSDYIKLLLNQEDPATVGRVMAYYDYHNRARSEKIGKSVQQLQNLYNLQQSIEKETEVLVSLKDSESQRMDEFNRSREMRESILLRLERYISDKDDELQSLTTQMKELEKLLTRLNKSGGNTVRFFEDIPPFRNNKGKMPWPIRGEIIHQFGSRKKSNGLTWDGVLIRAKQGSDVKAINNGKVVFADWFRNLGLLMIIEHGDGYMSLYGHNESLLKNQGDWVLTGETIATIGDSGGQNESGLYFEIRQKGEPVNPVRWCKK